LEAAVAELKKVYAACFTGQLAWLGSSLGVYFTVRRLRNAGVVADTFSYGNIDQALARIDYFAQRDFLTILFGYSLGVSTATFLQSPAAAARRRHVDLLLAVAGSRLGENYPIDPVWTKRAVLYLGNGLLSSWESPTFNHIVRVGGVPHILLDFHPDVVAGTMYEVSQLQLG
jgi:hypothetical protein